MTKAVCRSEVICVAIHFACTFKGGGITLMFISFIQHIVNGTHFVHNFNISSKMNNKVILYFLHTFLLDPTLMNNNSNSLFGNSIFQFSQVWESQPCEHNYPLSMCLTKKSFQSLDCRWVKICGPKHNFNQNMIYVVLLFSISFCVHLAELGEKTVSQQTKTLFYQ